MINKKKGQIFTPWNIANCMVSLISDNNKNKEILEPSFWKGVFFDFLLKKWFLNLHGVELDYNLYTEVLKKYNNITLINDNFFNYKENKFNVIIWNPPYIENNEINEDTKKILSEYNNIDNGEWDLYYYFIYHSINLLKENGELIFIVPVWFLTNTYANTLRNFIYEQWQIKDIFILGEHKIFNNKVSVETLIFKFKKTLQKEKDNINVYTIKDDIKKLNKIEDINFNLFDKKVLSHFKKKDIIWNINNEENLNYQKNINKYFDVYVWCVSWYDKAYKITEEDIKKLNNKELAYIKKIVKAKHCKNNTKNKFDYFIFLQKEDFSTEEEFKETLPNIYSHLIRYKDKLENRYWIKNKTDKWWAWATIRNLKHFIEKKDHFFIPIITRQNNQIIKKYSCEDNIIWWGDVICLSLKKEHKQAQKQLEKILLSKNYIEYINKIVPKKWNRKCFTHNFINNLKI